MTKRTFWHCSQRPKGMKFFKYFFLCYSMYFARTHRIQHIVYILLEIELILIHIFDRNSFKIGFLYIFFCQKLCKNIISFSYVVFFISQIVRYKITFLAMLKHMIIHIIYILSYILWKAFFLCWWLVILKKYIYEYNVM